MSDLAAIVPDMASGVTVVVHDGTTFWQSLLLTGISTMAVVASIWTGFLLSRRSIAAERRARAAEGLARSLADISDALILGLHGAAHNLGEAFGQAQKSMEAATRRLEGQIDRIGPGVLGKSLQWILGSSRRWFYSERNDHARAMSLWAAIEEVIRGLPDWEERGKFTSPKFLVDDERAFDEELERLRVQAPPSSTQRSVGPSQDSRTTTTPITPE